MEGRLDMEGQRMTGKEQVGSESYARAGSSTGSAGVHRITKTAVTANPHGELLRAVT